MHLIVSPDSSPLVHIAADAALYLHITGGTVGIASGAVALLSEKGGRIHRAAGNVFFATMLVMAARQGLGVAALPCYLADRDPRLVRLTEPMTEMASALWLLTHPDLRRVARVRAFVAFTSSWMDERKPELEGATSSP